MAHFGVVTEYRGEYAWLSNFHPVPVHVTFNVEVEGHLKRCYLTQLSFNTVEAAYIACKSTDSRWWKHCAETGSDRQSVAALKQEAKELEQEDPDWLRPHWDALRVSIMFNLLCEKFSNSELAKLLKGTVGLVLEEGNTWKDDFWGIDRNRRPQRGLNMLGKLHMLIRDNLIAHGNPYGNYPTLRGYLDGFNRG